MCSLLQHCYPLLDTSSSIKTKAQTRLYSNSKLTGPTSSQHSLSMSALSYVFSLVDLFLPVWHTASAFGTRVKPNVSFTNFWLCVSVDGRNIWVSVNLSVRMANKQAYNHKTYRYGSSQRMRVSFLFVFKIKVTWFLEWYNRHMGCLLRFSECISQ